MSRRSWQEHIGPRAHMLHAAAADAGYAARTYDVVERVAVIDISGVLVNEAWEDWGISSYGRITEEIRAAVADSEVDGILLRVNSPGGETNNAFETADEIIQAAKTKPVWAISDVSAYSAGYLLASSADKLLVAPKTGGVGSIGVYALHLDFSKMLDKSGIKATFIEDPEGKTDGHPLKPLSDEAQADIQASVDRLSGMFFEHVARRRKLTVEGVRAMHARIYEGAEAAIEAGLADGSGLLWATLARFRGYLDARRESIFAVPAALASANSPQGGSHMEDEVKAKADATAAPPAAAPAAPIMPEPAASVAANDAEEIVALCAIAGLPAAKAQEFLGQKKSAADVRAALIAARITADDEIISQVAPHSGTSAKTKPEDSPIVKAAEQLAAARKKE